MLGNLVTLLVNGSYFSLCVSVCPQMTKSQSLSLFRFWGIHQTLNFFYLGVKFKSFRVDKFK